MVVAESEAVVAAVDAPSIYDIPKVLHSEGLELLQALRKPDLSHRTQAAEVMTQGRGLIRQHDHGFEEILNGLLRQKSPVLLRKEGIERSPQ